MQKTIGMQRQREKEKRQDNRDVEKAEKDSEGNRRITDMNQEYRRCYKGLQRGWESELRKNRRKEDKETERRNRRR